MFTIARGVVCQGRMALEMVHEMVLGLQAVEANRRNGVVKHWRADR